MNIIYYNFANFKQNSNETPYYFRLLPKYFQNILWFCEIQTKIVTNPFIVFVTRNFPFLRLFKIIPKKNQNYYRVSIIIQFHLYIEFIFSKNKNENENGVLQLLYFEFKYAFGIIFCILYFKIKNSNMRLVDTIENNKNREYAFGNHLYFLSLII